MVASLVVASLVVRFVMNIAKTTMLVVVGGVHKFKQRSGVSARSSMQMLVLLPLVVEATGKQV
jgi:hypothetical protein